MTGVRIDARYYCSLEQLLRGEHAEKMYSVGWVVWTEAKSGDLGNTLQVMIGNVLAQALRTRGMLLLSENIRS